MTHYTYIPDAVVPDASLKATMSIPEADALYLDAEQLVATPAHWVSRIKIPSVWPSTCICN